MSDDLTAEDRAAMQINLVAALENWRPSVAASTEPGSALRSDDEALKYPVVSASGAAFGSLAVGTDHLFASLRLLKSGWVHAFADLTLARGALVGACQCIWLLQSEDPTVRTARARSVWKANEAEWRKFLEPIAMSEDVADRTRAATKLSVLDKVRELTRRAPRLNLTNDVLPTGLAYAFPDNTSMVDGMMLWWRQSSAASHALPWAMFDRVGVSVDAASGEVEISGSIEESGPNVAILFSLCTKAWDLYAQRSGQHHRGTQRAQILPSDFRLDERQTLDDG